MSKRLKIILFIIISILCILDVFIFLDYKPYKEEWELYKYNYEEKGNINFQDAEVIQTIYSKKNNLSKINIYLDPIDNTYVRYDNKYLTANIEIELKDSKGNSIEKYKYEKVFFGESRYKFITFEFPTIKDSKNKIYYLYIRKFNDTDFNIITSKSDRSKDKLISNGEDSYLSIMYNLVYKSESIPLYVYIVVIIINIIMFISLLCLLFKRFSIHTNYLILSIILSLFTMLLTPLYSGNDEISHFARVYDLSNGKLITSSLDGWPKTSMLTSISENGFNKYESGIDKFKRVKEEGEREVDMQYTSVYSILSYIPQTIGLVLSKIITKNTFIWPYIVRLFQAIFCIICIYYSIKIIPFGKKTLMFIGLLPTTLEATSLVSADSMLVASTILFISKILYF